MMNHLKMVEIYIPEYNSNNCKWLHENRILRFVGLPYVHPGRTYKQNTSVNPVNRFMYLVYTRTAPGTKQSSTSDINST
jgi:hypothetical protein